MHEHILGLSADLRMKRHAEYEAVVLPISKVELVQPKSLHVMRAHKAMLKSL